jgi:hypothetical protein
MAARFQYDAKQELLLLTFEGELGDADLMQAYETARRCAAAMPVRRGLIDGRAVTTFSVSAEEVKTLAHLPPMLPATIDRCIVVEQDFLFGMARMYQMLGGDSRDRLRVCRNLQEAYEYLNIQPPQELQTVADSSPPAGPES